MNILSQSMNVDALTFLHALTCLYEHSVCADAFNNTSFRQTSWIVHLQCGYFVPLFYLFYFVFDHVITKIDVCLVFL